MTRSVTIAVALTIVMTLSGCGGKTADVSTPQPSQNARTAEQQRNAAEAFAELESEVGGKTAEEAGLEDPTMKPLEDTVDTKPPAMPDDKPSLKRPMKPIPKNRVTASTSLAPKTKYPLRDGRPVWFYNPNHNGLLGGVGTAPKGSYPTQKRIAKSRAQADLTRTISVIVNAEVRTESIRISGDAYDHYKTKLETLSRQSSTAYLDSTRIEDEWVDPDTGELFVWLVLPR